MADVEVSYKGSTIGSLSASGTLTLETEGKYCEDDLTVSYTSPGGGGNDPYDFSGGNILAIVGHGTEYVTTDIYPAFSAIFCTKLKDVNSTSYEYYWGTTKGAYRTCVQRSSSTKLNIYVNNWGAAVEYQGYSSGGIITPLMSANTLTTNVADKPLLLFKGYYNGNVESQIAAYTFYGLNIMDANLNFVVRIRPWLENGTPCVKDLESGAIYYNGGSGAFDYIDDGGVLHSA